MKIPKTIIVSGTEYTIILDHGLIKRGLAGEIDSMTETIRILPAQTASARFTTLLHECIHAINWKYCHDQLSEEQIENMDEGLLQVAVCLMGDRKIDWGEIPVTSYQLSAFSIQHEISTPPKQLS
jgi:hypothetical protein